MLVLMLYSNALGICVKGPGRHLNVLVHFIEYREYDGVLREPNMEGCDEFRIRCILSGFLGMIFTRLGNGFPTAIAST